MEKIVLDGKCLTNKAHAHEYIAAKLSFPSWYGANLDALWDCLGAMPADTEILLLNREDALMALGDYGKKLLDTFVQAAMEYDNISFELE